MSPPPTSRRVRVFACVVLLLALGGAALWRFRHPEATPRSPQATKTDGLGNPPTAPSEAFAPGAPPRLLPPRQADPDRPALAWERLLAADGSPAEDLAALNDLVVGYLHAGGGAVGRRGIGFNEDLVPALTDSAALGDAALPADHPAIRDGKLIDRWGTLWQVHPLAADKIELRSAGPDRRLYTADDLVR